MMRDIVVNGRFLSRRVTGVERYGREILSLIESKCRVEKTQANGMAGHAWEQFLLPAKLRSESMLWSPANTGPLFVRNQAVTIHDLSPIEHPEWFKTGFGSWYRLFLPILARQVRVVFVPSNYVKKKVMKRFGVENVIITPNGVDASYFYPKASQSNRYLPEKYILFVGSIQPRKNLQVLFEAWHEIKNEFANLWLIVAGDSGSVFERTNIPKLERTQFLGYISDGDLPGIYAKATVFVMPSLDEGFGLPVLEAMACGVPVIVSNGGALPETVGNAALTFKASDSNDLAMVMKRCLSDNDLRSSLVTKGLERIRQFTWQKSAESAWKALNEI